jgi:hypothetical protein
MVRAAAKALKRRAPRLHELLKRFFLGSKFPAFTLLNGKFTLTAPKLISVPPTEPHVLRLMNFGMDSRTSMKMTVSRFREAQQSIN